MLIKQLSVFTENKPGGLAPIIETLGKSNIDISALSLADTSEYGILRLIVNNSELAVTVLKEIGVVVKVTDVLAVAMDDTPGGLSKILEIFVHKNINVDYMYAFVGSVNNKALMVVKVSEPEAAAKALADAGISTAEAKDIYRI
ncbi:MAG: acetolactate synthase [Clostridia bacterium]|nr:acetolactate synthase [Clostridia bacterium]MBP3359890.1 acetolactate synthase [Clostridia bacterium]